MIIEIEDSSNYTNEEINEVFYFYILSWVYTCTCDSLVCRISLLQHFIALEIFIFLEHDLESHKFKLDISELLNVSIVFVALF